MQKMNEEVAEECLFYIYGVTALDLAEMMKYHSIYSRSKAARLNYEF